MFDLDQTISEWRRQMLAAGIKTPTPLEELEIHLREDFEQRVKSGLKEAEAFKVAAEKIGQSHLLQKEFKKVEKNHKIMRTVLLIIGWLAAVWALFYGVFIWEFNWNFFQFSPQWNLAVMVGLSGILAALTAMWFLAKANSDKATHVVSLLLCVLLAGIAVCALHADESARGIIGGHYEVPFWYRAGRTLVLWLPGAFWAWWTWRHLTQKNSPTHRNQPTHSD